MTTTSIERKIFDEKFNKVLYRALYEIVLMVVIYLTLKFCLNSNTFLMMPKDYKIDPVCGEDVTVNILGLATMYILQFIQSQYKLKQRDQEIESLKIKLLEK